MVFVSNAQGTLTRIISSPVYQGSNLVNEIVLLAPFPSSNNVTVSFTLPNGVQLEPVLMTSVPLTGLDITDEQRKNYNAWALMANINATEYAGLVGAYFTVYTGYGKLNTYATTFEVLPGGAYQEPTVEGDILADILNALARLNITTEEAIEKSISYIRYTAPDKYLLNKASDTGVSVEKSPSNIALNGLSAFDLEGMTEYLSESNITDPTGIIPGNNGNAQNLFYESLTDTAPNDCGFIIDLGESAQIGLVQIYAWDIVRDITLALYLSEDGTDYGNAIYEIDLSEAEPTTLDIFQLNGKATQARYVKVVQKGDTNTTEAFKVKGVEVYEANNEGQYLIKRTNGNVSSIDAINGITLLAQVQALTAEAEGYAGRANASAQNASAQYQALIGEKGESNGIAPLGADGKVPSEYLPPLVITDYIKVNSVADLTSTVAQKGDIAYIETTVDGVTTTQFYILTANDYTVPENWLEYNPSVAGSALYANNASEAENAQKVGGIPFNGILTQSQYQAMVTNGTVVNGTIYLVEV